MTCPGLPSAHLGNSTERLKRLRARRRRLSLREALTRRRGTPLHLTNYLAEQVAHSGRLSSIWTEATRGGQQPTPGQGRSRMPPREPRRAERGFQGGGLSPAPGPLWLRRLKPGWCSVSAGELTAPGHRCHQQNSWERVRGRTSNSNPAGSEVGANPYIELHARATREGSGARGQRYAQVCPDVSGCTCVPA